MISLQVISKVLNTKDYSIINNNALTDEFFVGYENEFNFIKDHFEHYGNVPDKATFLDEFNEFEIVDVQESDKYLLDTLFEENLYYQSVSVVQKVAEILKTDSNEAVAYLQSNLSKLTPRQSQIGVDIISQADKRLEEYNQRAVGGNAWYIPTGFLELDDILNGWTKGEELAVLFARTGQGKSWVLAKTLANAWQLGNQVGYISPEMSASKIGYRFDTLVKNYSNTALIRGYDVDDYKDYIDDLKTKDNKFIVATPLDFQKKITISKLKNFCIANKLDILGIDGITYLSDERYKKGDNKTISLTNISEDLMSLSLELKIPIIVVVQSNRLGKDSEDKSPELENIRDSDGIAHNATKVLALKQSGAGLELLVKKHRDGKTGGKVIYYWDIDKGEFIYIPSETDGVNMETRVKKTNNVKQVYNDVDDVF